MQKTCPPNNKDGFSLIVVAIAVLIFLGAAAYLYSQGKFALPVSRTILPTELPVAERINPEPLGPNSLTVGDVPLGKTVFVESIGLAEDGYVVVVSDSGASAGTVIGKSTLLKAGTHTQVAISLNTALTNGFVILVRLQDKNGKDIQGEAGTLIEVQKNIGNSVVYYDSEY